MNLFYIANQDLADGSAHALYLYRSAWWLAATAKEADVHILHAGKMDTDELGKHFGYDSISNLNISGLPSVRRKKKTKGLTLNAVFYFFVYFNLRKKAKPGDALIIASFPKIIRFLNFWRRWLPDMTFVYEVHQLACLDRNPAPRTVRSEWEALNLSDLFVTTTRPLQILLEKWARKIPIHLAGLACGYEEKEYRNLSIPANSEACPECVYIGSVYHEQGVRWLLESWATICQYSGIDFSLKIIGGSRLEVEQLKNLVLKLRLSRVFILGSMTSKEIKDILRPGQILLIPSLKEGRMPYVAITKAYDYLAFHLPIVASDLPSISEVLRDGEEALLFQPGNAESLGAQLNLLINDQELRKCLASSAAQRSYEYSWEKRSRQYWKFLESSKAFKS